MTEPTHSATLRIKRRKRYKRLAVGSLIGGIVGSVIASFLDQTLLGTFIYWAGFLGMLGVWQFSPVTLFDERDTAIERKASDYTLGVFGIAGVFAIPGLIALEAEGLLTLPAAFDGMVLTFVAVFALFGVIYTALR